MELRGQDKEIGMPNSLSQNPTCRERRRDNQYQSIRHDPDLYHHHQLNLQHQTQKPIKDFDLIPDPPPATAPASNPTAATSAAANTAPAPGRSISRSPIAISTTVTTTSTSLVRYRECLKNHAANMGGHVVDGCGEFMPSGEEGSLEALNCAACECHRNFHRKAIDGKLQYLANSHCKNNSQRNTLPPPPPQLATSLPTTQPPRHQHHRYPFGGSSSAYSAPIAPTTMTFHSGGGGVGAAKESSSEDLNMFNSNLQGQLSVQQPSSKKRFRTKFSQEQKEKMTEFAEKIEWKIQKQDEQEVQQFCSQVGVKREVFKVWMHNNKQAKKKQM